MDALAQLEQHFNFSFVIPGKLAGMAPPHGEAFELLKQAGIKGIISLTEKGYSKSDYGDMEYLHLPIPDFTAPTMETMRAAVAFIDKVNGPVVVHCFAGIGRTGTILAGYLVSKGEEAYAAIAKVRRLRPYSIETDDQEALIYEYEVALKDASG